MVGKYDTITSYQSYTVRVGPFINLPGLLRSYELDPQPVFEDVGFNPEQFRDPDSRIPYVAAGKLLARSASETKCPHLGLALGERTVPSHLGMAGFLVHSAPDVGTALRNIRDYLDLHDQGGVPVLITSGDGTLFGYTIHLPGVEGADQIYDLAITIACNILRALCGSRWCPTRVFLSRAQPHDPAPYRRIFRAPIEFNAENNGVMFPTRLLGQPVSSSNPLLHTYLEKRAKELHAREPLDLINEVRRVIYQRLANENTSVIDVAEQLGMEKHTLVRRLQAEGTSFRQELELARYSLGQQLLCETALPVTRIATLLGYAEVSVFCRAFRRWSGISPAKWRKQNFAASHGEQGVGR